MFPAMLFGHVLIYTVGVTWLAGHFGMEKAFAAGFRPFVNGDVLKCALAAFLFPLAWAHLYKRNP